MFRLYSEEKKIFEFADYGALLQAVTHAGARRVLEFGPGLSTLALVEAGAAEIHSCEYQDRWMGTAADLLGVYPQVRLHHYENSAHIEVPTLPDVDFDLAFVDSPVGLEARSAARFAGQEQLSRWNTLQFALARAPLVLLHDARREHEQNSLGRLAEMGHGIEMIDTPKGIALIRRAA